VILADNSGWMEYDRATCSAVHRRLVQLIGSGEEQLSVTEPVVMEVLAAARSEQQERDLRRLLLRFPLLRFDAASGFEAAARLQARSCRWRYAA
jgi:predicted nucleic acid-binding protein